MSHFKKISISNELFNGFNEIIDVWNELKKISLIKNYLIVVCFTV